MLKRKIIQKLDDWKKETNRKALIIEGPQHIGKTFTLRTFAYENYKQVVYINFNQFPYMRHIFEQDFDIDALILQITLMIPGARCVPHETLILLEEIEYCPSAISALIKLSNDARYDAIGTRTILNSNNNPSEITVLRMHALDFEEFLWANNVSNLAIQELKNAFNQQRAVSNEVHQFFINMFREYTYVGGMPKAVRAFTNSHSFEAAQLAQRYINDVYLSEIMAWTDQKKKTKINDIFHSLPDQVRRSNKKFKYSDITGSASYRTHWESVLKLYEYGWLFTIFKVDNLDMPLIDNHQKGNFKLCVRDIGLLSGQLEDADLEYLNNPLTIQKNILLENSIADVLVKRGLRMYYMEEGKNTFFVVTNKNRKIGISFDDSNTLRSMNRLVLHGQLDVAYDLIVEPTHKDKNGMHVPLYNLMFIE